MGKLNRPKPELKVLCACANKCGLEVKPGNKYINGHNRRGQGKLVSPPQICACNTCGLMTNPGCKYIDGHNNKGKNFSRTEEYKSAKSKAMKEYFEDPKAIEKTSIAHKKWWEGHPEAKEKQAIIAFENTTKRYQDPLEREKTSRNSKKMYLDHPELREQKSIHFKEFWEDPIAREKMISKQIERFKDPNERWKSAKGLIEFQQDPENRKKQSDEQIEFYKDPEERKKQGERMKEVYQKNPILAQKISERMMGAGSAFYIDGRCSGENYPYSLDFNERLKELIRDRDNRQCQLCSLPEEENSRKLPVHHIDYDRKNCDPRNLISLCDSCHSKTNFNRVKWASLFQAPQRLTLISGSVT
jgi:hypothetical protein